VKVAIVGSRGFAKMDVVRAYVSGLPAGTIIVSGAGKQKRDSVPREKWGVDEHAEDEALRCGLAVTSYPAKWKRADGTINKGAGFARNGLIAAEADRVVAFWDGSSRGTKDTIDKARKAGKRVEIVMCVDGHIVVGV
jgi:hypothetical protein